MTKFAKRKVAQLSHTTLRSWLVVRGTHACPSKERDDCGDGSVAVEAYAVPDRTCESVQVGLSREVDTLMDCAEMLQEGERVSLVTARAYFEARPCSIFIHVFVCFDLGFLPLSFNR